MDIRVDGKRYGRGGYFKRFPKLSNFVDNIPKWVIHLCSTLAILSVLVMAAFVGRRLAKSAMLGTFLEWIRERLTRRDLPNAFKEHFHLEYDKTLDVADDDGKLKKPVSYVYA